MAKLFGIVGSQCLTTSVSTLFVISNFLFLRLWWVIYQADFSGIYLKLNKNNILILDYITILVLKMIKAPSTLLITNMGECK